MEKIGRNDPCPCGSGKKFKKCHMGREEELQWDGLSEVSLERMADLITGLPAVHYGRSREMTGALDLKALTGRSMGVKFVDLHAYLDLNLFGTGHLARPSREKGGGIFINLYKTVKVDPDHVYLAISPGIEDSTLVHELAHVLDYLAGSNLIPGTLEPLSLELGVPVDHLEHPEEFGHWLGYLAEKFGVRLDADDTIILHLYREGMLIKGKEIQERTGLILRSKSERILTYLSEHSREIDDLIRNLPGYIGPREKKD